MKPSFEWNVAKNIQNQKKHGVSFQDAQYAFFDPKRIIAKDIDHSVKEERFFCIGKIKQGIVTIRFTYRKQVIRIFGAGFWRKGRRQYEKNS
jgi:uncharacterized protein